MGEERYGWPPAEPAGCTSGQGRCWQLGGRAHRLSHLELSDCSKLGRRGAASSRERYPSILPWQSPPGVRCTRPHLNHPACTSDRGGSTCFSASARRHGCAGRGAGSPCPKSEICRVPRGQSLSRNRSHQTHRHRGGHLFPCRMGLCHIG